jgi:MFS-type transporter involved in bile tolerance (Atg22 family)
MLFFFSLIPATALAVAGYFVLYASTRTEGGLRSFGRYLAIWLLFLAGATLLGGILAPALGIQGPMERMEQHMQRMEHLQQE